MQFLAAKSLWINLWLLKYAIPLAIWRHMSNNFEVPASYTAINIIVMVNSNISCKK